jgi:KH domain
MASTPTPDSLTSVLARLVDRLGSLEARLDRIEASAGLTIASIISKEATTPSPPTKGKGRADAPAASSKATPAKKKRPTKKAAIPSSPVPLPLAQTITTEGKTDRHLVTVVIPDASAQHVVGQGGKGLKQIHDISGARVNAYSLATGSRDERHVSIRGTDIQIGDALVVLGKRLARKKIRTPKAKKTGPSTDLLESALRPPIPQQSSSTPTYSPTQRPGPSTGPRIVVVPTGEPAAPPSTPLASTSPNPTPIVPSSSTGTSPSSGHLDSRQAAHVRGLESLPGRAPQTARRSRGRW